MKQLLQLDATTMRWFLLGAWLIIAAKCVAVAWAIQQWAVPVHPAWIVVPTVLMAALATVLWVTHREEN